MSIGFSDDDNSQPAPERPAMEKIQLRDTTARGRVIQVSEERDFAIMRSAGRDVQIEMPPGGMVPPEVRPGSYGQLTMGRSRPVFIDRSKELTTKRGRDQGIER